MRDGLRNYISFSGFATCYILVIVGLLYTVYLATTVNVLGGLLFGAFFCNLFGILGYGFLRFGVHEPFLIWKD